jgi:hypothetical protein
MPAVAAVVLAHADARQVRRLIASLGGIEVFLHCDAKTPDRVFAAMTDTTGLGVHAVRRVRTSLASWSLVAAEVAGVRMVLERTRAEHIIVMSGNCYPLVTTAEIEDELAGWRGRSRLELHTIPYPLWGRRGTADGGLFRFQRRYVTVRDQVIFVRGLPLCTVRRAIPADLLLHASSQWKIYAREHAMTVLRVLDDRPDLVKFWRKTLVPEESCVASILRSPMLVGAATEDVYDDHPWYIDWPSGSAPHPRWLGEEHFPALEAARFAQPRDPAAARDSDRPGHRKLFARKISSAATGLVDMIDAELRR